MQSTEHNEMSQLIEQALSGDKDAMESLMVRIQDPVFHLSLRMLGMISDAEDATQEILLKVMTHLSSFRQESSFSTWVFRIAANHLKDYKKSMFAQHPLSFEFYGSDIINGSAQEVPDLSCGVDRELLARELKLSCTNVMLQCLDAESRCIFILGTMFKVDSRIAGEILEMSPEAYRQRLSRIRKKVGDFLQEYCGLGGKASCRCANRINYAIASHRLDPTSPEYSTLEEKNDMLNGFIDTMEEIDDLSAVFSSFPLYGATEKAKKFLTDFLSSDRCAVILNS